MKYLNNTQTGEFITLFKRIKLVTHVTKKFFIIIIGARPKIKIKEGI